MQTSFATLFNLVLIRLARRGTNLCLESSPFSAISVSK